jgi:hypothetical protein
VHAQHRAQAHDLDVDPRRHRFEPVLEVIRLLGIRRIADAGLLNAV